MQARLIEVAIAEFGLKGLDGASTRGIAAAAGTAMSSITYHYGGKEGLYLAAADHIATHMLDEMGDVVEEARAALAGDAAAARAAIQRILARFAEKMAGEAFDGWAMFIVREQQQATAAFDRLWDGPMGTLLQLLVELVRVATGARDRTVAAIATVPLFGQVLVLRSARATCLRLLGADRLSGEVLNALKHRIAVNTDIMLDRLALEGKQG